MINIPEKNEFYLQPITAEEPDINGQASITAVVLTYNRPDRCADSIRHNSRALGRFKSKIIVFNNGTMSMAMPEVPTNVSCRVINSRKNLGVAAKNMALAESESEFVLMMDDDAYIHPQHLDQMIRTFRSDDSIGAVSFKIRNDQDTEACLLPTVFHGCACGFRSAALRKAGGYPADFLYYGEEYSVSFALYNQGYRIVMLDDTDHVFHARDNAGRDKNRILRFLVRNNVRTWSSFLPHSEIAAASLDTIRRYALVARKENAVRGFLAGCAEVPLAMLRGIMNRTPLTHSIFDKVLMINQVHMACASLKAKGIRKIILCSTGKLPSIWLKRFKAGGISVAAFCDSNICWKDRTVKGIPVITSDCPDDWQKILKEHNRTDIAWVTGTGSLVENNFWAKTLLSSGMRCENINQTAKSSASFGNYDLLHDSHLAIFKS